MKITRSQLKRIIHEELQQIMSERRFTSGRRVRHPILGNIDVPVGPDPEEREREYREGPAPDVAVGGVGMMSPKERAEVERLRGTGPRPPSGPSPEQISVARSMMDPQRQRGTLSPGEVARLSTGAFTDDELQQMRLEVDPEFARQQTARAMSAAQAATRRGRFEGDVALRLDPSVRNQTRAPRVPLQESLINDFTEAVLAKLTRK